MIRIEDLVPTQDYIRDDSQIPGMIRFVKSGGLFTKQAIEAHNPRSPIPHGLIRIVQFDDGNLFLNDGHHRGISIKLGDRSVLDPDEFFIERWSYSDYEDIVFLYPDKSWMGWVTPHDPRTEVRLPDLFEFKCQVKAIFFKEGEQAATDYIRANRGKYCKPRNVNTIDDLVDNYCAMATNYTETFKPHQLENSVIHNKLISPSI